MSGENFWENKQLRELNKSEWESLCDGCALCCLNKIEEVISGKVFYTNVACNLLNLKTCKCSNYKKRFDLVDDCLLVTLDDIPTIEIMPDTCAYRRMLEGRPLPEWHHLVSGDRELVHNQDFSILNKVIAEDDIDMNELENYITYENN